jgi:hypothetical protein
MIVEVADIVKALTLTIANLRRYLPFPDRAYLFRSLDPGDDVLTEFERSEPRRGRIGLNRLGHQQDCRFGTALKPAASHTRDSQLLAPGNQRAAGSTGCTSASTTLDQRHESV